MVRMLQIFDAQAVHAALPWQALVDQLEQAFVEGANVPMRHSHVLDGADVLLLMPAWSAASLGLKLVTVMPGNAARSVATVQASYLLLDRATGQARALLDGEALTLRRTAAASALAARYLARSDARCLLVVGTGHLAPWLVRAHCALRPALEHVLVWGRDAPARTALARSLNAEGIAATPSADLQAAVRSADIVTCATTSTSPLVLGHWLQPGTHVDLVGGFRPDMREVDDDAVVRARVFVDTYAGALSEAGDLVQPMKSGRITRAHIVAELAELARSGKPARVSASDITLFKSVGTALEDLAAAEMVLRAADRAVA